MSTQLFHKLNKLGLNLNAYGYEVGDFDEQAADF